MAAMDDASDSFGIPALDDWYDKALAEGQGFKTEAERQAYINSLGDMEKHPMFATTTEDLEGNPYVEALRSLREEGKSPVEVATMYKDEGNEWVKKADTKSLHEAYIRYTHALDILDGGASAAASGVTSEEKNEERTKFLEALQQMSSSNSGSGSGNGSGNGSCSDAAASPEDLASAHAEKTLLQSQVYSNRAMVSLTLKNYGSCRKDADHALALWPGNVKAHYRKSKALLMLKRYDEALASSLAGLGVDPGNDQLASTRDTCMQEQGKERERAAAKAKEQAARAAVEETRWMAAWDIITGAVGDDGQRAAATVGRKGKVIAGYACANQQPAQLQEILPHLAEGRPAWPVLILYPQYGQLDVVQGAGAADMVVAHLAEMFPEIDDLPAADPGRQNPAVPWDRDGEYRVSKLAVYAPLEAGQRIETVEEWLVACREQCALRGELGQEAMKRAQQTVRKRDQAWSALRDKGRDSLPGFGRIGYLDVHLGCTFRDVFTAPNHVLSGGLLTLLVFVRGNKAHKKFLADVAKNGHGVWLLHPSGSDQSGERLL